MPCQPAIIVQQQPDLLLDDAGNASWSVVAPDFYGVSHALWDSTYPIQLSNYHPGFYGGTHLPSQEREMGAYPAKLIFVATVSPLPDDFVPGTTIQWWVYFIRADLINEIQPDLVTPAVTSADSVTFSSGTASSFTVTTGPSLTFSGVASSNYPGWICLDILGILPDGVTFNDNGDGTATLTATSALSATGNYLVEIRAINSVGSNGQVFALTVI